MKAPAEKDADEKEEESKRVKKSKYEELQDEIESAEFTNV